ncbi:MAG: hypothetical protein IT558_01475 [Alphaproteobacteria bacterium]|nr:hypothetical protein [Alphaproteobacteria bacterium]
MTVADPDRKKILRLYALFGAGLILCVVPFPLAALLSMIFIFGVLVAAYIVRTGASVDGLIFNHATFIIRTIWIGSFIAALTMTAASIYLLRNIDNSPLDPCINQFLSIGPETALSDLMKLQAIFQGCWHSYWMANIHVFITSGSIAAGPPLLYFIVRYARGLSRALDGYRVAKPESWF